MAVFAREFIHLRKGTRLWNRPWGTVWRQQNTVGSFPFFTNRVNWEPVYTCSLLSSGVVM